MNKEKAKIIEAMFKIKLQIMLKTGILRDFNNCYMIINDESIIVIWKN